MMLRRRVLLISCSLLVLVVLALAVLISHDSPCRDGEAAAGSVPRMKAIIFRCYGSSRVLKLETVAKPEPADDELLVRVHAASVNPLDWHYMRGKPYIMRLSSGLGAPSDVRVGVDFAGTVEEVGKDVTKFNIGDEVFGGKTGALAEFVTVRESRAVASKPSNVSFERAAAVPVAAITALQAVRDKGQLQPGQRILINGASGGVGTFAVQIAKSMGADVTAVCSTRNVKLVKGLGADHVIDYTRESFTQKAERYDVILDNVGNHPLLDVRRALKPGGVLVMVGGSSKGAWLGPMMQPIKALVVAPFVDQKLVMFLAELNQADLDVLAELMRQGKMKSVIDKTFPLDHAPEAIDYLEQGHARGKVVVTVL